MTLEELMDTTVATTQTLAIGHKKSMVPVQMYYVDGDGALSLLMMPLGAPSGDEMKKDVVTMLRAMLASFQATAYVIVLESWVREFDTRTAEGRQAAGKATQEGLRHDPQRLECLVYTGCDKDRGLHREYRIARAGNIPEIGAMTGFTLHKEMKLDKNSDFLEGWPIGLLW